MSEEIIHDEKLQSEMIQTLRSAYPFIQESTGYQRMIVKELIELVLNKSVKTATPAQLKQNEKVKKLLDFIKDSRPRNCYSWNELKKCVCKKCKLLAEFEETE